MKLKFILLIVASVLGFTSYYFISFNISEKNIKIKCHYMAYACGDCYPQYRIDEILEGNEANKKLLKSEINIEYKTAEIENKLDKKVSKCIICYDFYFTGQIKRSKSKGLYLLAENVEAELRDNKCCN